MCFVTVDKSEFEFQFCCFWPRDFAMDILRRRPIIASKKTGLAVYFTVVKHLLELFNFWWPVKQSYLILYNFCNLYATSVKNPTLPLFTSDFWTKQICQILIYQVERKKNLTLASNHICKILNHVKNQTCR
jgi:hypothetical protein